MKKSATIAAPSAPRLRTPALQTTRKSANGSGPAPKESSTDSKNKFSAKPVSITDIRFQNVVIPVEGTSPLIVHAWDAKTINQMTAKHMQESVPEVGREKKDPLACFRGALYHCTIKGRPGWGVPAPAFKGAAVNVANLLGLKMTQIKMIFHVNSYTVPILSEPLAKDYWSEWDHRYAKELEAEHQAGLGLRRDLVRLSNGEPDIRFRPWWPKWRAVLEIEYLSNVINLDSLTSLIDAAGKCSGICEGRPSAPESRTGEFGRFKVVVGK